MSNLIGGLKKVCVYDPGSGDRVVLFPISAATTDTPTNPITSDTPTGAVSGGKEYPYTIGFFDGTATASGNPSYSELLESWQNNDTPVRAVLLYQNAVRFWNEDTCIDGYIESQAINARDGVSPFSISLITVRNDPDIYLGINLLWAAMRRGADGTQFADADFVPVRMVPAGDERWRVVPIIRMTVNSGTLGDPGVIKFVFPFPGETVFFGSQTFQDPPDSPFRLIARNYAGTSLGTQTYSTGIQSFALPANTYTLEFEYTDDGADSKRPENPFIRVYSGQYTTR